MCNNKFDSLTSWRYEGIQVQNKSLYQAPYPQRKNVTSYNKKKRHPPFCKHTSYGIILCGKVNGEIKYALIKKRLSYGVTYILRGDWKDEYFYELSYAERDMFIHICLLQENWEHTLMHLWIEWKSDINNIYDYCNCRDNFIKHRHWLLHKLQTCTSIFPYGVWEFPKGHREKYDVSPQQCALRELQEETGIDKRYVQLLNIGMLEEIYRNWTSNYYVGFVNEALCQDIQLKGEASQLVWLSFHDALQLIPNVFSDRKGILTYVHELLSYLL